MLNTTKTILKKTVGAAMKNRRMMKYSKNMNNNGVFGGRLLRQFAVNEAFAQNLNSFSKKVRTRKSAADLKKLQKFLNYENEESHGLYKKINQTANMDNEFDDFLQKFKKENKEYPNILDLSRFFDEDDTFKKDEKMRQEEIDMLKEFKKRQVEHKTRQEFNMEEGSESVTKFEPGSFLANKANAFHQLNYMTNDNFFFIIIDRRVTCQVTTLNRINHFQYLVFCGNSKGMCGYGIGKGLDFEVSMTKAFREAKKNLISIDIGKDHPFPRDIKVKFNRLRLYFNSHFKLESWGNPVFTTMIILAGLDNVLWYDFDRNWNRHSMVYGFFKLISKNKSLERIAEDEGVRKFDIGVRRNG